MAGEAAAPAVSATPAPAAATTPAATAAAPAVTTPASTSAPPSTPAVDAAAAAGGIVDAAAAGLSGAQDGGQAAAAAGGEAAAAAAGADTAPAREAFDPGPEGYQEWLAAKWEFENDHGTLGADTAAAADAEAARAAAMAEVAKPADKEQQQHTKDADLLAEPAAAVTPEGLATLLTANPELHAVFEAKPELKETFYEMARTNAQAAPLMEIFPDVESAKFANETAGTFVELQSGFEMAAEDPESFPAAFAKFEDLFRLRDANGEYLRDAAGNIRVGEDFNLLANHMVSGYHTGERAGFEQKAKDLEQKIANAVYPNESAKAADVAALEHAEMAIAALRFVEGLRSGDGEAKPDLSKIADPEVRGYYERKEQELEAERQRLGQDKTKTAQTARKAERTAFEQQVRGDFGGHIGGRIGELIKQKLDAGTFIPSYVLEDRDVKTNAPLFALRIMQAYEAKIQSIPQVKKDIARLQMQKPSAAVREQRLQLQKKLIEQFLPRIVDAEVLKVQAKERGDRDARRTAAEKRGDVAQIEPRSGGAPAPRTLTDAQIAEQARETVKKMPDYAEMSGAEKMAAELSEKYRLRGMR